MKITKILVVVFSIAMLLPSSEAVHAKGPGDSISQSDMKEGFCEGYKKLDAQLKELQQNLLQAYQADKAALTRLKAAHESWVKFRDAHIEAIYPTGNFHGSVYPMCVCIINSQLTEQRIQQLKEMLNPEEGDVCAASVGSQKE